MGVDIGAQELDNSLEGAYHVLSGRFRFYVGSCSLLVPELLGDLGELEIWGNVDRDELGSSAALAS